MFKGSPGEHQEHSRELRRTPAVTVHVYNFILGLALELDLDLELEA